MNQREQFEKEIEGELRPTYSDMKAYVAWLEQRHNELVRLFFDVKEAIYNAPDDAFGVVARPDSNGDPEPQPVKHELLFAIQQQLKKNGAL